MTAPTSPAEQIPLQGTSRLLSPAFIGLLATLVILTQLDPAGSYPMLPEGPGLTIDETFNVQQGVYLVEALRAYGIWIADPPNVREVFGNPGFLPDHPPAGRFWLGLHHHLWWALFPPKDPEGPFVIACARAGSATAFGLTVWLVGRCAYLLFGHRAGVLASLLVALMPRLWGHAHLASLETTMNLAWMLATWQLLRWPDDQIPSTRASLLAGALWGLALLTKIQGILLGPVVLVWCFARYGRAGWRPLLIWGITGAAVLVCGWPWIWLDPINHLLQYLGRTTNRAELSTYFLGITTTDRNVSVIYPLIIFLATVPLATLVFGGLGWLNVVNRQRLKSTSWRELWIGLAGSKAGLLTGGVIFPLLLFSIPKIAVYDGERLFLMVFPLWSIFAGQGAAITFDWIATRFNRVLARTSLAVVSLAMLANIVAMHPVSLSSYSAGVGYLPGAARLGLELDYWGESITREMLDQVAAKVPAGETITVGPVLHQFQLAEMLRQSPSLRKHRLQLKPLEGQISGDYVLIFCRRANLPQQLTPGSPQFSAEWNSLIEVRRQGVTMAVFAQRRHP